MVTVGKAWRDMQKQLEESGINPGPREGKMLVAHGLDVGVLGLIEVENTVLEPALYRVLVALMERRAAGEPLGYVLGHAGFYGRVWAVGDGVLVPRPDTEILVEAVLGACPAGALVGELGVGSGVVLGSILAERADVRGVACEIDETARGYAQRNFETHGVDGRVTWAARGEMAGLGPYDVLFSNPPYIADNEWRALEDGVKDFEPKLALVGDRENTDGLRYYRDWVPLCTGMLKPGGMLAMEMGWTQAAEVAKLFEMAGLREVRGLKDLGGRERVVVGVKDSV